MRDQWPSQHMQPNATSVFLVCRNRSDKSIRTAIANTIRPLTRKKVAAAYAVSEKNEPQITRLQMTTPPAARAIAIGILNRSQYAKGAATISTIQKPQLEESIHTGVSATP